MCEADSSAAPGRRAEVRSKNADRTTLALVAGLTRQRLTHRGIVDRMRRWRTVLRGHRLCASQMHRWLAGYFGSETKATIAVMASIFRHPTQCVALRMTARPAAWAAWHSGGGYSDNAHRFTSPFSSALS